MYWGAIAALAIAGIVAARSSDITPAIVVVIVGAVAIEAGIVRVTVGRTVAEGTRPRITAASLVTLFRGVPIAVLAGFLVVGRPDDTAAWVPVGLFALAAGLDAVDGALARATGAVTDLGARLDGHMDALAVLVGVSLAVAYDSVPAYYFVAGIAQYVFLAARRRRRRRGRPVFDLPPSQRRRVVGSAQMIVIVLALAPVPGGAVTYPLATVALVALVGSYVRDWQFTTGRGTDTEARSRS